MEHVPSIVDLQKALPNLIPLEFVAAGGFKAVFKATIQGRVEALKVVFVPPEAEEETARDEIVARVKREIDALRMCHTGCLVSLGAMDLRLIAIGGHDYLVYSEEFLTGKTLKERIRSGHCPGHEEVFLLARCLGEALDAIAKIDHIHRDVKPENVIATDDRERPFVLLDLGIAYKIHGTDLTVRGGPPGTLRYMAPELLTPDYKSTLDIRSDIYSAGVTLFEYAAGEHPIVERGEDVLSTALAIRRRPAKKLSVLRSDLPDSFCLMVDRCMKKRPALRYPNPDAMLKALEGAS